jgi:uncharacterized protein
MKALLDWLTFIADLLIFLASQAFWIHRALDLGHRFIPGKSRRTLLAIVVCALYLVSFAYTDARFWSANSHFFSAADQSLLPFLLEAPFWWWFVGSLTGFLLIIALAIADHAARAAWWLFRRAREAAGGHGIVPKSSAIALDPPSPARRRFLEQAAVAVSATPFGASAYGLLYGRFDLEISHQRIAIRRLPKAFEGFRIVQLSDLHISPFMPADRIRRYATIANQLRPHLVALTGDYVAWDAEAQGEVVQALAGLRAPCGVFGCLGNHEYSLEVEDSISRLFAGERIRILRQERAPIQWRGETLNLIGIDYESRRFSHEHSGHVVEQYLAGSEKLVAPDMVNILLSHNPNVFDRAAELGIDLTLAGHTHGGQLSLEFVHRGLNLSHGDYPYNRGWYQKGDAQIYVNRGIGTTGFPIRFGARPEITVLELARAT